MKLVVEVEDFVDAARAMRHEVAENVELCLTGVAGRLESELVGVDPAGVAWAADYDTAARSVVAASALIANGAYRTSQLFAASGHNYARAEAASTTGGGGDDVGDDVGDWTELLADHATVRTPDVPTAGGAGADTPADWWLVEHTVGYVWPGGHQDRLRATAAAWRSSARGIELGCGVPLGITGRFLADRLPEADDMQRVCSGLHDRLTALVAGYRALADACDQYAEHLDTCHTEIRNELTDLAIESAALQAGGLAASIFTAGLAELPTQAAQVARVAATAARIERLIEKLIQAAKLVGSGIARVAREADEMIGWLTKLNGVPITRALVQTVGTTKAAQLARETAALNRFSSRARALPDLATSTQQLQRKFKHAEDFGFAGHWNPKTGEQWAAAMRNLIKHPDTVRVGADRGRYLGDPAIISYNPTSGSMVLQHPDGAFWSACKLDTKQLMYVRKYGELR